MNENQQIWAVVLFYGAAQGVVVSTALVLLNRGRRAANLLLSAVVFVTTVNVASWFLVASGWVEKVPFLAFGPMFLGASFGPLFYFYTQTLLRPDYKPRIHLILLLALIPDTLRMLDLVYRGFRPAGLVDFFMSAREGAVYAVSRINLIKPAILTAYMLLFLFLSWRQIRRTEDACRDVYSDGGRAHVIWLKVLSVGGLCLFAGAVVVFLLNLTITGTWAIHMEYIEALSRCLIIQAAALASFFLPEAFTRNLAEFVGSNGKQRPPIEEATAVRILRALREHMAADKPYRAEDLRLADVADKLSISPHALSQLINERLHTNFSDFVNKYRVEDTQARMEHPDSDHYTLLAIARESGFNSKTSFYRSFKKHAGMSPSEYRVRSRKVADPAAGQSRFKVRRPLTH